MAEKPTNNYLSLSFFHSECPKKTNSHIAFQSQAEMCTFFFTTRASAVKLFALKFIYGPCLVYWKQSCLNPFFQEQLSIMKHDWYFFDILTFLIYWQFFSLNSVLGSLHSHALLPWWNTMFNIHKSSNLQHLVRHLEVARCKCRAAETDAQALRRTWWLPHMCILPLKQGAQWNTPAEAKLRQRERAAPIWSDLGRAMAEVDVWWRSVQDSVHLCQVLQQAGLCSGNHGWTVSG